ncbi:hypothetical protein BCON_0772g00010 [Botryotinia convoluta]|uniref:Aminotransferase class I/classII large domain-containing protein n=1 Tax=Botryotinia convoluta TaxID=54673 RepID=A0A4Z1H575_9HELO|nr:hypothetical protein BCON_0772g00010 [Botryotinia convoluta]
MKLPGSFSQSLETGLQLRHQQGQYFRMSGPANELGLIDFGSNDSLCLRGNGSVRKAFLSELQETPNFHIGAGGSRILDGSNNHVVRLERFLADYHGAEEGLLFNSGYEANVAIYSTLPQRGDVIVHDAMIHASIRDGIRAGRASIVKSFAHNDLESLDRVLEDVKNASQAILEGHRTVFIAIESFYSMEGDMTPMAEVLAHVNHALPAGNSVFIIDEAHSTGLIGPSGSGYIRHLGLEKECIIQMQSYAKAAGALGAIILCNSQIKEFIANYARSFIYSTGPLFPTVAAIRASVNTLRGSEGDQLRQQLQARVKLFYDLVIQHPKLEIIQSSGVLKFPTLGNQTLDRCYIPIIPILTGTGLCHELQQWLRQQGFLTHALRFPVVLEERIRFVMHVNNTLDNIRAFVRDLMEWGETNMMAIAEAQL